MPSKLFIRTDISVETLRRQARLARDGRSVSSRFPLRLCRAGLGILVEGVMTRLEEPSVSLSPMDNRVSRDMAHCSPRWADH